MLDYRSQLIWGAGPVGLALGALLWLLLGNSLSVSHRLTGYEARLTALDTRSLRHVPNQAVDLTSMLAHPLFSVGGVALTDATVLLQGLSVTPKRAAALLVINGQPAEWVERGATKDGVTLQQVLPTKVVIDTATGSQEIGLDDRPGVADQTPSPTVGAGSNLPSGYRMPPPPASAPGSHR